MSTDIITEGGHSCPPPLTPTALNSKAQCRVPHTGLPITPMTEPKRGSTKGASSARLLALLASIARYLSATLRVLHENLLDLKSQVAHFIDSAIENRAYDIQVPSNIGTTAPRVCEIQAGERF